MWMTITSAAYFVNPLISKDWKKQIIHIAQPSEIEGLYIRKLRIIDGFAQAFSLTA
jgi:hypothetical protein